MCAGHGPGAARPVTGLWHGGRTAVVRHVRPARMWHPPGRTPPFLPSGAVRPAVESTGLSPRRRAGAGIRPAERVMPCATGLNPGWVCRRVGAARGGGAWRRRPQGSRCRGWPGTNRAGTPCPGAGDEGREGHRGRSHHLVGPHNPVRRGAAREQARCCPPGVLLSRPDRPARWARAKLLPYSGRCGAAGPGPWGGRGRVVAPTGGPFTAGRGRRGRNVDAPSAVPCRRAGHRSGRTGAGGGGWGCVAPVTVSLRGPPGMPGVRCVRAPSPCPCAPGPGAVLRLPQQPVRGRGKRGPGEAGSGWARPRSAPPGVGPDPSRGLLTGRTARRRCVRSRGRAGGCRCGRRWFPRGW